MQFDQQVAIINHDISYIYADIIAHAKEYQKTILAPLQGGDCVAIVSDYSLNSIALFIALVEKNAIIVPITSQAPIEIEEKIATAGCHYCITFTHDTPEITTLAHSALHPMLEQLKTVHHAGLILFSSGSTGKPKAMVHDLTHLLAHYDTKKPKNLVMLLFLMFDHIGGLNTMLNILSMGATMVIPTQRTPQHICQLVQEYHIAVMPSSPTFLNLIVMSGEWENFDLSSLRMVTYGTEPMPESLLIKLKSLFPKVKFLQTFGTSETGIATTSSKSSDSTLMRIDDPSVQYKIVDNVLWLKSDTQILGYLNASMESFEDGWFNTGDLVETVEDGYLRIIGRSKEVINVGGQKVLPMEVESVVLSMPEIADCMVRGEANSITGQSVVVDVVLHNSADAKDIKKTVRLFCKTHLDSYKIPTKVIVTDHTNFSDRFKKMRLK